MEKLQELGAANMNATISVHTLPGTFNVSERPLAYVKFDSGNPALKNQKNELLMLLN